MINLKAFKLSQICSKIGSGATPRGGKSAYTTEGTSLIRSQNVLDFNFTESGLAFINETQAKALANVEVQERDVLINITGDSVARVCQVPKEYLPARVNQHVAILRADTAKLCPEFLKYSLLTKASKDKLLSLASTGATRNALTKGMLEEFEILAPEDVNIQIRIAEILSALDDKIELNHHMNQTLEKMAQTLFRQYFVDGIDAENLPEGWRQCFLGDFIDIKHGYAFKGAFFSDEPTVNILLTPGNFKIGGGFGYKKFKYYQGEVPEDYVLDKGDLIVTMTDLSKDGDTLGYSALVPSIPGKNLLHNQRIGKVSYKTELPIKFYLYWLLRTDEYRRFVLGSATGTTVRHTSPTRILEYQCLLPKKEMLLKFEKIAVDLYKKELSNELENHHLTETRDTLLPKLMSGEIDVMQAEKAYEPVLS